MSEDSPQPADPVQLDIPQSADEADVEHYHFHVSKKLARRIDQYLVDRVPRLSRNIIQRLIEEELVRVNGKPTKSSYKLKADDEVDMVAPPQQINELVPEPIPLDVLYEDDHFMAINKQTGLMVHPARGVWTGTLVNGLVYYGRNWSGVGGAWRPGILHRLDRNTTGIMLVAKSDEAHWRIARQFENRTIQKTYLAVAQGVPELLSDIIDLPIGRDRYVREKQAIRKIENGGRQAVTRYDVEEIFEVKADIAAEAASPVRRRGAAARYSLLKLMPKTGRTHQLRVHLSALGFPLVGDTMYGGQPFQGKDFRFERQALHAYQITFVHPITLAEMTLEAPIPEDFKILLDYLRAKGV